MEPNSREVTTAPRLAATVMLLRDEAQSLEVFLLKRHGLSDVLAGAYVVPGGTVDAADGDPDMSRFLDRSETDLQSGLQESSDEAWPLSACTLVRCASCSKCAVCCWHRTCIRTRSGRRRICCARAMPSTKCWG